MPRLKPVIPPHRVEAVTFDSEPEARRRLMNSAFCERCGKLALRTRADAHNYIGLLLSKRWQKPKPNQHTLKPYECPYRMGWHVGRDSQTAELLRGKQ
jgi:hypothetical protein